MVCNTLFMSDMDVENLWTTDPCATAPTIVYILVDDVPFIEM